MYTEILAQGVKLGCGATGLDNPVVHTTVHVYNMYQLQFNRN